MVKADYLKIPYDVDVETLIWKNSKISKILIPNIFYKITFTA